MDERHRVLIADSYPDEAEQLKKELSGKYNVISVRDNGGRTARTAGIVWRGSRSCNGSGFQIYR